MSFRSPTMLASGEEENSLLEDTVWGKSVRTVWWSGRWTAARHARMVLLATGLLSAAAVSLGLAMGPRRAGSSATLAATNIGNDEQLLEVPQGHQENARPVPYSGMGWPNGTYWPSLFCFSVFNVDNADEVKLIRLQLKMHIGIFSCDDVATLSGRSILLGEGHRYDNGSAIQVYSWLNPATTASKGSFEQGDNTVSFKNTQIFISAWNILVGSGALFKHNWTVKADPDAVLFPERLRWHLKPHTDGDVPKHLKNCNYKGLAALYGSLEVFNQHAMWAYKQKHQKCMDELPWQHWGEDQWIDTCMWKILGSAPVNDYTLVGDHRCMKAECEDTWRAAFHDYKTEWSYLDCYQRSVHAKRLEDNGDFCCLSAKNTSDPCNSCWPGQEKKPGTGGWCAASWENCHKCGGQSAWCRSGKGGKNVLAKNGR